MHDCGAKAGSCISHRGVSIEPILSGFGDAHHDRWVVNVSPLRSRCLLHLTCEEHWRFALCRHPSDNAACAAPRRAAPRFSGRRAAGRVPRVAMPGS
jgi:hypothetical protein